MILLRPVGPNFSITQDFGENPDDYPATNGHSGIDFGGPEGNPVRAAAEGIVTRVEIDTASNANPKRGYGFHVRIRHTNDHTTLYAHLLEGTEEVSTGQHVQMGDLLAKSGGVSGITGFSTGAHLHFEYRLGEGISSRTNPAELLVDEIPPEAGLFSARVIVVGSSLNIRSGPGAKFAVIGKKVTGEDAMVFGLSGDNAWLQVNDGFFLQFKRGRFAQKPVEKNLAGAGLFTVRLNPEGVGLRVREGPGTDFRIIRTMQVGEEATVFGLAGSSVWLLVKEGYVSFKPEFLTISPLKVE
jgi:murein DD-endopeptidase MepM/ murein hydrolase activator NlpD